MNRRFLLRGLAVVAGAGGLWALYAAAAPPADRWATVAPRELVIGIPFEGQLVALENLELGPPNVTRELWQFNLGFVATDGREVKAGEPILRFDASELTRKLVQAQAEKDELDKTLEKRAIEIEILRRERNLQLAEAEARARKSELELSVPAELLSRRELETSRIDQQLARVEIDFRRRSLQGLDRSEEIELASLRERATLAASRVSEYQRAIEAMTVVAPRAGTVIVRPRNNDEKYKVGDPVWRADKVVQIPDLATLRAQVEIDEALGGRVAVGQRATFFLDAHPDRELHGQVEQITQSVQRKSGPDPSKILKVTVTIERAALDGAGIALRPAMRLRGQVEQERRSGALAIPEEAVSTDAAGLYVEKAGLWGVRRERPTLGPRSQGYFEVLAGLERGDRLRLPASAAGEGS